MKAILNIATVISVITYLFWSYLPKGSFYIGNAAFIWLLCLYLFLQDKKSNIKFILLTISSNNLLDEIVFDNTKLGLNEVALCLFIGVFIIFKKNI